MERSGGTRKQVALAGEEVQPVGQAVAAAGRKRIAAAISTRAPMRMLQVAVPDQSRRLLQCAAFDEVVNTNGSFVGGVCLFDRKG